MPTRFLKRDGTKLSLTSVSRENPLPVAIISAPQESPSITLDTLLTGELLIDSTNPTKDLLGNTGQGTNIPTFTNASPYKRFILVFLKQTDSTNTLTVRLLGRISDAAGNDAYDGWLELSNLSTNANNAWVRMVLEPADGKPLGCDIYRVEVSLTAGTASHTLRFSLKGER